MHSQLMLPGTTNYRINYFIRETQVQYLEELLRRNMTSSRRDVITALEYTIINDHCTVTPHNL